jgi:Ca-activated chloride channel family protein
MTEPSGLFDPCGRAVSFRGVSVEATLTGLLAVTRIEQRYHNGTGDNLEITYTFPLPVDAVLLAFEVEIGDRQLSGRVVARSEAEERYEAAIESGHTAFRLMKLRDGLYSAALGNVFAGEAVRIVLAYSEPIKLQAGLLRYRLPTTIAPRYGEASDIAPWQHPEADFRVEYPFEARIELQGALAQASVVSSTHALSFRPANGSMVLALRPARMDRDFVLEIRPCGQRSFGAVVTDDDGAVVMLNLLPQARREQGNRRDVVILLDCSGSMAGESIALAREGVRLALAQLGEGDRFALIRFGSRTQCFARGLTPACEEQLVRAAEWVARSEADLGGTELSAALREALAFGGSERGLDVLLLTDGEVWRLDEIAREARRADARIFAIGIGSAPAEDVLRELADTTGAAATFVTPGEDMPARIEAHFARMRQARITGVEVAWGVVPEWESRPRTALFAGDAFSLFARLPARVGSIEMFIGYADGTQERECIRLDALPADALRALARTAAQAYLPRLTPSQRRDWALRHQLVSDETDYIVTLERAAGEEARTLPVLEQTPHMFAAGWGGVGTVPPPMLDLVAAPLSRSAAALDVPCMQHSAVDSRSPDLEDRDVFHEMDDQVAWPVGQDAPRAAMRDLLERLDREIAGAGLAGLPVRLADLELSQGVMDALKRVLEESGASESQVVLAFLVALVQRLGDEAPDLALVDLLRQPSARAAVDPELVRAIRGTLDEL